MTPRSFHTCHWPGCTEQVPPKLWGCKKHWFMLPADIRREIWRTYRPGQELQKDPSREYIAAAREAQEWIERKLSIRTDRPATDGGRSSGKRVSTREDL